MRKHIIIVFLLAFLMQPLRCLGGDALSIFIASEAIDSASTALMVTDLSDGKVIASLNASSPLIPASIMKAVTSASLIDHSGIDFRYHTKAYACGRISGDILDGNLLIVGSGDPSLNSPRGPESPDFVKEVVDGLLKAGIREIRGRVIYDEDIFSGPATHPSWGSGDLKAYYGTGAHGFNFEANRSGKAAVANPAAVFERRLRALCDSSGIYIDGENAPSGERKLIADHVSPPLDEIMRSCMMRSDNLYAECLLRTLAVMKGKPGSTAAGADLSLSHWKKRGADTRGVTIADGSGLSRRNRVTARFMTNVLADKSGDPYYASFFPLAGEEGTLRNFLARTTLSGYVAMKTGSMSGIQCYAGYLLDENYVPTHTIVVILNSLPKGRDAARKEIERFLLTTFASDTENAKDKT